MIDATIHQTYHGYRRGHELLATSVRLDQRDAETVRRLSDLSGTLSSEVQVETYLTAYPVPSAAFYAVARTWMDRSATRAGCVITHTLLVPTQAWGQMDCPAALNAAFKQAVPETRDIPPVVLPADYASDDSLRTEATPDIREFVARFFGEGIRPIVWLDAQEPEALAWRIATSVWPRLRRQLAWCTLSLQPRTLEGRPFDLLFAPAVLYSRFHKLGSDKVIGTPRHTSPLSEPWQQDMADAVALGRSPKPESRDDSTLWHELGDDPSEVRKWYAYRELSTATASQPGAFLGLLDIIDSVAPLPEELRDLKVHAIDRAIRAGDAIANVGEAAIFLALIATRLERAAYQDLSSGYADRISSAVASAVARDPEQALQALSANAPPQSELASVLVGVARGARMVSRQTPSAAAGLWTYQDILTRALAVDPTLARDWLQAAAPMRDRRAVESIATAVSGIQDARARAGAIQAIVPELLSFAGNDLAETLLGSIGEDEISAVLDSTASSAFHGEPPDGVVELYRAHFARRYPKAVRDWCNRFNDPPQWVVRLQSATYDESRAGLQELMADDVATPLRLATVLSQHILDASSHRLPEWLAREAETNEEVVRRLMVADWKAHPLVRDAVRRLAESVNMLPVARVLDSGDASADFRTLPFAADLYRVTGRAALSDFLAGHVSLDVCRYWGSTPDMLEWLGRGPSGALTSVFRLAERDSDSWTRAWAWLPDSPAALYSRTDTALPAVLDSIVWSRAGNWSKATVECWRTVIRRAASQSRPHVYHKIAARALDFSLRHRELPISPVVCDVFEPVYSAVVQGRERSFEDDSLFGFLDWDRGKQLRRRLIETFMGAEWPPGDLVIAASDPVLVRKLLKRLLRARGGNEYLERIHRDLLGRLDEPSANRVFPTVRDVMGNPNVPEDWD